MRGHKGYTRIYGDIRKYKGYTGIYGIYTRIQDIRGYTGILAPLWHMVATSRRMEIYGDIREYTGICGETVIFVMHGSLLAAYHPGAIKGDTNYEACEPRKGLGK